MKTGEIKIEEEGEKDKRIERERKKKYVFLIFFFLIIIINFFLITEKKC
jgi:hypothetical protein